MIKGIGTDIIEIWRIEKALLNDRFLDRFFSENERTYIEERKNAAQTVAGIYAAKEAFSKALGTGIRDFGLSDVEILHDNLGKPYIYAKNNAKIKMDELLIKNVHLSISHSEKYAVATVIAEGDE